MPVVQRAQRTEEQRGLAAPRLSAKPDAAALGDSIGEGIQTAAYLGSRIVAAEQEKADNAFTTASLAELQKHELNLLDDPENGALRAKGRDAGSRLQPTMEQFDSSVDALRQTAQNDKQRQSIERLIGQKRVEIETRLSRHVAKELDVAMVQDSESAISLSKEAIGKNFNDPARVEREMSLQEQVTRNLGRQLGWGKDTTDKMVGDQVSASHAIVVSSLMANGRATEAATYLEKFGEKINNESRLQLTAKVKPASDAALGQTEADLIWTELGPRSLTDPVKQQDMENKARERFKGEPERLKFAIADLRERASAHGKQQAEVTYVNLGTAAKAVEAGRPTREITSMQQYQDLSPGDQAKILDQIEKREDRNRSRVEREENIRAARSSRAYTEEQRERTRKHQADQDRWDMNHEAFNIYSRVENLTSMSRAQVESLLPDVGPGATKEILAKWDHLHSKDGKPDPNTVHSAQVDQDVFYQALRRTTKIDPYEEKLPTEIKDAIGRARLGVERAIAVTQEREKRQLNYTEKEKITQQVLDDGVLQAGWFGSRTKVPAVLLTPDEMKDARVSVKVNDERTGKPVEREVTLSDIAAEDRVLIVDSLRRRGMPITEQSVAELWLKQRSRTGRGPQ